MLTLEEFMKGQIPDGISLELARSYMLATPAFLVLLGLSSRPNASLRLRFIRKPEDVEFDDRLTIGEFRRFAQAGRGILSVDDLGGGMRVFQDA